MANSGKKASTIGRRLAALGYVHRRAGHEPPGNAEAIKAVLRGIRRTIGTAKAGKSPATADVLGKMLALCPDSLIGLRDRALLSLGFAGAFRRSELCALEIADLVPVEDGYRVLIRRSKGDQEGQGQTIAIPHGYRLRPVQHVQAWLAAAAISSGPVFRAVALGGRVSAEPMVPESIARVVKKLAGRLGLDPKSFAGHSLRSGYVTSAVAHGAAVPRIMDQTRHRSVDVLMGYHRAANLFVDHSGAGFL
jgi:integrase